MIKNFNTVNLHSRCEIAQLAFTSPHQSAIASISHDYFLKITDINTLKTKQELNLLRSYLTGLDTQSKIITVGTGEGELITINSSNLEIINTTVLHTDCITGILEQDNQIVTVGYDGMIKYTDKRNYKTIKLIELDTPIRQIQKFGSKYYLAGIKSFEVENETVKQFTQYNHFLSHLGKLYGTNDQNGFTCITQKEKRYVPCQNMVGYGQGVIGTSWQTISYFATNKQDSISCLSVKADRFRQGDTINSLLTKQNKIFGGAQSGNMYVFQLDMSHSWLQQ